jgi:hypothetical protein
LDTRILNMIPNTKVQNRLGMLSCMEDHKV